MHGWNSADGGEDDGPEVVQEAAGVVFALCRLAGHESGESFGFGSARSAALSGETGD